MLCPHLHTRQEQRACFYEVLASRGPIIDDGVASSSCNRITTTGPLPAAWGTLVMAGH